MTFEEWWRETNYSDDYKLMCLKAFRAGEDNFNEVSRVIDEKEVIINFLKKELIKKTSYRQVMKRQYRELKQKCDALERYIKEVEK